MAIDSVCDTYYNVIILMETVGQEEKRITHTLLLNS